MHTSAPSSFWTNPPLQIPDIAWYHCGDWWTNSTPHSTDPTILGVASPAVAGASAAIVDEKAFGAGEERVVQWRPWNVPLGDRAMWNVADQ